MDGLKSKLNDYGYAIVQDLYDSIQLSSISEYLDSHIPSGTHAQRLFLDTHPSLNSILLTDTIWNLVSSILPEPRLTRSIFFDKDNNTNWFVGFHQDVSIGVKEKLDVPGYGQWTNKNGLHGVIPPEQILKNSITLRIHLDPTTKENGALRVIPKSHLHGIVRKNNLDSSNETVLDAEIGDVLIMSPLLFHASSNSNSDNSRRIIHLEFSNKLLDGGLHWKECILPAHNSHNATNGV